MAAFAEFENRIAVLTGGASGIGRELLLQLVQKGAHVAVCDIDREKLEAAARRARASNPKVRVSTHLHDVSDEEAVRRFVTEVAKEHKCDSIHLLFNNAGVVGAARSSSGSAASGSERSLYPGSPRIIAPEHFFRCSLLPIRVSSSTRLR